MIFSSADAMNFQPEGIRAIEFSFSGGLDDVCLAGFANEAQIEPLIKSSSLLRRGDLSAKRIDTKVPRFRPPWKKATALYQISPLVTVVLATGAFVFPRIAAPTEPRGVAQTPIYHFHPAPQHEATAPTDDIVTAQQIRALDELLALPTGPDQEVQIHDWA